MSAENPPRTWRSVAAVAAAALITVAVADAALQQVRPLFPPVRHVHEGAADLAGGDPHILVVGSSHARSFDVVKRVLAERTGGRHRMVTVPVEMGAFTSYRWVLEHRLAPLIDERDGEGELVRGNLRHLMLVTTFYDMCSIDETGADLNIPARAWTFDHFFRDFLRNGLTAFNRNYVRERWKNLLPFSVLVQDRGAANIAGALKRLVRPEPESAAIEWARQNMEAQYDWCHDPREQKALEDIADFAAERNLELTVILFPLMPEIVTEKARRTTLKRYAEYVAERGRARGFRVVDLTSTTPLRGDDFAVDFDHVTHAGNEKFADWVLEHDLAWMLDGAVLSAERRP